MIADRRWYIYALVDPRTGAVRYIGKSFDPAQRLRGHIADSRRMTTASARWILGLRKLALAPCMRIIDAGIGGGFDVAERLWIAEYRRRADAGYPRLLNHDAGGRGADTKSAETRRKMSEAAKGRPRSEETRRRLSDAMLASPHYAENCLRLLRAGTTHSEESRRKISYALRARPPQSDATRAKRSSALRGRPKPDHVLEALRAGRQRWLEGNRKTES